MSESPYHGLAKNEETSESTSLGEEREEVEGEEVEEEEREESVEDEEQGEKTLDAVVINKEEEEKDDEDLERKSEDGGIHDEVIDAVARGVEESDMLREQDRFLPICNIARVMRRMVPESGKMSKESKLAVQEAVSEFISFITSEASDRCIEESRKTITCDDLLFAIECMGFDMYVEPLKIFLNRYREATRSERPSGEKEERSPSPPSSSNALPKPASFVPSTSGPGGHIQPAPSPSFSQFKHSNHHSTGIVNSSQGPIRVTLPPGFAIGEKGNILYSMGGGGGRESMQQSNGKERVLQEPQVKQERPSSSQSKQERSSSSQLKQERPPSQPGPSSSSNGGEKSGGGQRMVVMRQHPQELVSMLAGDSRGEREGGEDGGESTRIYIDQNSGRRYRSIKGEDGSTRLVPISSAASSHQGMRAIRRAGQAVPSHPPPQPSEGDNQSSLITSTTPSHPRPHPNPRPHSSTHNHSPAPDPSSSSSSHQYSSHPQHQSSSSSSHYHHQPSFPPPSDHTPPPPPSSSTTNYIQLIPHHSSLHHSNYAPSRPSTADSQLHYARVHHFSNDETEGRSSRVEEREERTEGRGKSRGHPKWNAASGQYLMDGESGGEAATTNKRRRTNELPESS